MQGDSSLQILKLEYDQINQNFRFLADVRFKLLALVPILGGAAVYLLSHSGLQTQPQASSIESNFLLVALVALLGFLATLGITLYDQRNSELYNALMHRAKYIEEQFRVAGAPGGLKRLRWGGNSVSGRESIVASFSLQAMISVLHSFTAHFSGLGSSHSRSPHYALHTSGKAAL